MLPPHSSTMLARGVIALPATVLRNPFWNGSPTVCLIHICFGRCFCTWRRAPVARPFFGILPYLSKFKVFSPTFAAIPASPLRSQRLHLGLHSQARWIQSQRHFLLPPSRWGLQSTASCLLLFSWPHLRMSNVESSTIRNDWLLFVSLLFPPSVIYSSQTSCSWSTFSG